MSQPLVEVMVLSHGRGLALPAYQTALSAGLDLPAALDEPLTIQPGQIAIVPTGLALAIPAGWEGQVRPRSGLAIGKGLTVVNAPGTIDADYRGELKVGLINLGSAAVTIQRGERVAQLIIAPVARATLRVVDDLPETARGAGGFGHTGA
ncbi:deoxyuridine 5'-triphosphate nucleotidohydrolase Dut [Desulfarculus baarsii DSM 2075]|uniref:Deoxyuridine 5'-triphosphate nucleotidohydrolase n=1 Tax=Desulfarculus baarsii (strain ATCC 33931 / DSM 2075 / LMG 7858 / VKM B-1802 / 2st14) TaxID=644282 RepID=E1QFD3_DESB2|nr:dUTP diphosphatase [Desulfarculus baarsii]ADK84269.1 deoxyuridine 5'-triphosphate nucleotidohydrolase Dut [Desulfarculus baarsii DSM 2075]